MRELVGQITEFSDITLQKLIEETNKDPETSKLRQTIADREWHLLPPDLRKKEFSLSTEMGLIFVDESVHSQKPSRVGSSGDTWRSWIDSENATTRRKSVLAIKRTWRQSESETMHNLFQIG